MACCSTSCRRFAAGAPCRASLNLLDALLPFAAPETGQINARSLAGDRVPVVMRAGAASSASPALADCIASTGRSKHPIPGRCAGCGRRGATLGCRVERCSDSFHLACASAAGCTFFPAFLVACRLHAPAFAAEPGAATA